MTDVRDTRTRPLWRDRRFATYWSGQTLSQPATGSPSWRCRSSRSRTLPRRAGRGRRADRRDLGAQPALARWSARGWTTSDARSELLVVAEPSPGGGGHVTARSRTWPRFMSIVGCCMRSRCSPRRGRRAVPDVLPALLRGGWFPRDQYLPGELAARAPRRSGVACVRRSRPSAATRPGGHRTGGDGRRRGVVPRAPPLAIGSVERRRAAGRGKPARGRGYWRRAVEGLRFLRRAVRLLRGDPRVLDHREPVVRSWRPRSSSSSPAGPSGWDPGQIGLAFGIGAVGGLVGAVFASPAGPPGRPWRGGAFVGASAVQRSPGVHPARRRPGLGRR